MSNNRFFEEFPEISTKEWEDVIQKDLKGADRSRKLVWRTLEGFEVEPFYRQENLQELNHLDTHPGEFPYTRGNSAKSNDWKIRQDIVVADAEKANATAMDVLGKGVESIAYVTRNNALAKQSHMEKLMKNIVLDAIEMNFVSDNASPVTLTMFDKYVKDNNLDASKIEGSVNYDPIGHLNITGGFSHDEEFSFEQCKGLVEFGKKELPNFKVLAVNAFNIPNAGANLVQELGFALSMGNEYIARLVEKGLSVDDIAPRIKFNFAVSTNYFMEIAKFRAARTLWANIVKSYKPSSEEICKMNIHCVNTEFNKSIYDPYVNMLRTQTEAMSAVIGGIDSLTVAPFNYVYSDTTVFSERIARNQQLLLKEECNLDKVVDPSAGSYYIEQLTAKMMNKSWELFLSVEEKGGYVNAFKAEFVQDSIDEIAAKRKKNVATRRETVLGTNQFPNFSEFIKEDLNQDILTASEPLAEKKVARPINLFRAGVEMEELRLTTEKAAKRPLVQLIPIGNLNMRKARAMFATNFFACAGFEVVDNNGFKTTDEGVAVAKAAKADIVVVCSSDDEYATFVPEILEKLNGEALTIVAGAPACSDELKAKGVDYFVNVKSNLLETLKEIQGKVIK